MSMGDLFELRSDLDEPRLRAFQVMRETPHLTWLLLTKRVQALELLPPDLNAQRDRILLGATIGTQQAAKAPFIVDFISAEPLLEAVDLRPWIRWGAKTVIVGGESLGSRPGRECRLEWVRNIRNQCAEEGAHFFPKQLHIDGRLVHDPSEFPEDLRVRELGWRLPT
jgi:protein gp37